MHHSALKRSDLADDLVGHMVGHIVGHMVGHIVLLFDKFNAIKQVRGQWVVEDDLMAKTSGGIPVKTPSKFLPPLPMSM